MQTFECIKMSKMYKNKGSEQYSEHIEPFKIIPTA